MVAVLLACLGHWGLALVCVLGTEACFDRRLGRCSVNTLGTLATATIVQEALSLVFTKRPILNSISTGFTDRNGSPIGQYNQAVITRTLGIPAVGNAGDAAVGAADVDVSVTLNNFKQVRYDFTAIEYSSTNRDLIRERAEPMAVAIANYIVDQIAALWTPANFVARTGADAVANGATVTKTIKAAGWDYVHLQDVRKTLNKAGVPDAMPRFYVGNADVYGSLLTDLRIVGYLNNQANGEAIKTGKLPIVLGMGLAEYPNLPANGTNLVGFCGSPDSTVYAHRVPRDPRELIPGLPFPGNLGIVTEPRTGLSVMVVEYIDPNTLTVSTRLMWMNGVAKGNVNNGQLICTQ